MLNKNPIDDFFFYSTFDFLEFCLPICSRPPLPPFLHCRCIFVCAPSFHTNSLQQGAFFLIRNKVHVVIGQSKVKCSNAGIPSLIFGGLDNTMDRCTIEPSREEFEAVARVDDLSDTTYLEQHSIYIIFRYYQCIVDMFNPSPLPIGGKYLQARNWLRP